MATVVETLFSMDPCQVIGVETRQKMGALSKTERGKSWSNQKKNMNKCNNLGNYKQL